MATTAIIIIIIICYVILLAKLKPANESSELLQESSENLPVTRRMELLEKIKEERIKEYLDRRKRKT